jgi:urease accessory protein
VASLFFVAGTPVDRARRDLALDVARARLQGSPLQHTAGVTAANPQVIVLRVLAPHAEPAMALLRQVWAAWRQAMWELPAVSPRIWAM